MIPQCCNTCCPQQAAVTVNNTTIAIDELGAFFRRESTVDSTLTINAARTVLTLSLVPLSSASVQVYKDNILLTPNQWSRSGQVITLSVAIGANDHATVYYFATTAGDTSDGVATGTFVGWHTGVAIPAGYLACDGSDVSRTTYAGLYSVIGTLYGVGDNSTTFTLPDRDSAYRNSSLATVYDVLLIKT